MTCAMYRFHCMACFILYIYIYIYIYIICSAANIMLQSDAYDWWQPAECFEQKLEFLNEVLTLDVHAFRIMPLKMYGNEHAALTRYYHDIDPFAANVVECDDARCTSTRVYIMRLCLSAQIQIRDPISNATSAIELDLIRLRQLLYTKFRPELQTKPKTRITVLRFVLGRPFNLQLSINSNGEMAVYVAPDARQMSMQCMIALEWLTQRVVSVHTQYHPSDFVITGLLAPRLSTVAYLPDDTVPDIECIRFLYPCATQRSIPHTDKCTKSIIFTDSRIDIGASTTSLYRYWDDTGSMYEEEECIKDDKKIMPTASRFRLQADSSRVMCLKTPNVTIALDTHHNVIRVCATATYFAKIAESIFAEIRRGLHSNRDVVTTSAVAGNHLIENILDSYYDVSHRMADFPRLYIAGLTDDAYDELRRRCVNCFIRAFTVCTTATATHTHAMHLSFLHPPVHLPTIAVVPKLRGRRPRVPATQSPKCATCLLQHLYAGIAVSDNVTCSDIELLWTVLPFV